MYCSITTPPLPFCHIRDCIVGILELLNHTFLGVFVHDEHLHILCQQLAGVANVDGRLLLVSSQNPDLDITLNMTGGRERLDKKTELSTDIALSHLGQIGYGLWHSILQLVFNGSGSYQSEVLLYLVVYYIYSLVTIFLQDATKNKTKQKNYYLLLLINRDPRL